MFVKNRVYAYTDSFIIIDVIDNIKLSGADLLGIEDSVVISFPRYFILLL